MICLLDHKVRKILGGIMNDAGGKKAKFTFCERLNLLKLRWRLWHYLKFGTGEDGDQMWLEHREVNRELRTALWE